MAKIVKNLTKSVITRKIWSTVLEQTASIGFDSTRRQVFTPQLPLLKNIHLFRRKEMEFRAVPNLHGFYVLWICLSGFGILLVDGMRVELTPGEVLMVLPGQPHMRLPDEEGRSVGWLLIRFESDDKQWFSEFRYAKLKLSAAAAAQLSQLLTHYARRARSLRESSACGAALLQLLSILGGEHPAPCAQPPLAGKTGGAATYVRELCELMMQEPAEKDPFHKVALRWSVTPDYLRVLFRKNIGLPPKRFMMRQKLTLAQHLLVNSDLSITEIALRCGFSGIYPFSRFFRDRCGSSPRAYRTAFRRASSAT